MDESDFDRLGKDGRTYRECVELQRDIRQTITQVAHEFDNHLLSVSSGAFGVSLLFLKDFVDDPRFKLLLFAAWIAFGVAILANLGAKLASQWSLERAEEINEASYSGDVQPADTTNRFVPWIERLNIACYAALVLGFVFSLAFAMANQKGSFMAKKPITQLPATITKAPTPPKVIKPVQKPKTDPPKSTK